MADTPRGRGRPTTTGARSHPQIAIRVAPELRDTLAALAESAGVSVTAYVADVVARHVATATSVSTRRRQARERRLATLAASVAADRERRAMPDEQ